MIPNGLFSHVFLILLAIAIASTFIRPTLAEIGATQDKISLYQGEIAKVSEVNNKLARLVNVYNEVSLTDQTRLRTYLPDRVDTVAVPRDVYAIALDAGLIVNAVSYTGTENISNIREEEMSSTIIKPILHTFTVSVQGSYSQIKRFLELTEVNVYPLEVQDLIIRREEGGYLSAEISLGTYGVATSMGDDLMN